MIAGHPHPLKQMQVPESAFGFLDVRFEETHRFAKFGILPLPFFHFLPDKTLHPSSNHARGKPLLEFLENRRTSR